MSKAYRFILEAAGRMRGRTPAWQTADAWTCCMHNEWSSTSEVIKSEWLTGRSTALFFQRQRRSR